LESIRRRFGPFVAHPKNLPVLSLGIHFNQHKIRIGSNLVDGSWLHGSGDAQMAGVSNVAHVMQLLDRHVIALALLNAGPGEPCQTTQDDGDTRAKLEELARHDSKRLAPGADRVKWIAGIAGIARNRRDRGTGVHSVFACYGQARFLTERSCSREASRRER